MTLGPQGCLAGVYQRTLPGLAPILASFGECAHQQTAHMMCLILIFSLLCNCFASRPGRSRRQVNHHGGLREERREKRREGSRVEPCYLFASPSASALWTHMQYKAVERWLEIGGWFRVQARPADRQDRPSTKSLGEGRGLDSHQSRLAIEHTLFLIRSGRGPY